MRQSEDDVEVGNRQQLLGARLEPLGTRVPLALRAVPVAARVVRDGLMSAADTLVAMSSQSRSAASYDRIEHLAMRPRKMRSVLFPEAVACCADDVSHFEGGVNHRLIRFRDRSTVSGLETSMASIGLGNACR